MYSSDVAIWFHIVLICVKLHKLTNYSFEKKNFFWKFFWVFLSIYNSKTCSNAKKSICSKNLKVLPIWNHYHCFDRTIFGDFIAIFEKNTTEKKKFFFKIFFSNFCKSPFLIIIRRDLMKKNFLEISKKNFEKKIVFSNAECVVSGHWNNEILLKMQILFCILEDTSM